MCRSSAAETRSSTTLHAGEGHCHVIVVARTIDSCLNLLAPSAEFMSLPTSWSYTAGRNCAGNYDNSSSLRAARGLAARP